MDSEVPIGVEKERDRAVADEFDFHLRPKATGCDLDAFAPRCIDHHLKERLGDDSGRTRPKGGPQPLSQIAKQCELRHQCQSAPDIDQALVHATRVIREDADPGHLCRERCGALAIVALARGDQRQQASPDLTNGLSAHPDLHAADPLNDGAHGLRAFLARESAAVYGAAFGAHQHDLAQPYAVNEL